MDNYLQLVYGAGLISSVTVFGVLVDQIIGITATLISSGVFLERYGVPDPGASIGYLLFGLLFVTFGVFIGKMLDASTLELLLLQEWNVNISLMVIGYTTIIASLVGWGVMIRDFCRSGHPGQCD